MGKGHSEKPDLMDEGLLDRRKFIQGLIALLFVLSNYDDTADDRPDEPFENGVREVLERWLSNSIGQPITDGILDTCVNTCLERFSSGALRAIERVGFTGHDNHPGIFLSNLCRVCLF